MPEMPEVESLARFLTEKCVGRTSLASISSPSVPQNERSAAVCAARLGDRVSDTARQVPRPFRPRAASGLPSGKSRLVALARLSSRCTPKPSKSPLALRVRLDDSSGFDLTEAGTQRKLAVYVVTDPMSIPMVATLGPDPLTDESISQHSPACWARLVVPS